MRQRKSEYVGAQSTAELIPKPAKNDDGMMQKILFGIEGVPRLGDGSVDVRAIFWNIIAEIGGSFIVGLFVVLGRWLIGAGFQPTNDLLVLALLYAAGHALGSLIYYDYPVRRHLSNAITVGYLLTGRCGLVGACIYIVSQFLGAMFAGMFIAAFLSGVSYTANTIPLPYTVPLALNTTSTLGAASSVPIAVVGELLASSLVVVTALLVEFLNTRSDRLEKNHKRQVLFTSAMIGALVLVMGQFQIWTFNHVPYFTGLFATMWNLGTNAGPWYAISNVFAQYSSVFSASLPNPISTVWTNGNAGINYILTPAAGGIVGAIFFYALFFLGVFSLKRTGPFPAVPTRKDKATAGIVPTRDELIAEVASAPQDHSLVHPSKMK
jgi:glycerol uptake facilitator-like aquaporin